MAVKTSTPKATKPLITPDPSMWQRYSPHNEAPLAGATSLFLHGTILGMIVVGGMAVFWAAREEAGKPPKMDVVTIEGDGSGLEGGGGAQGSPGSPDAGPPKRTENITPLDNPPNQSDPIEPRPSGEKLPDLGISPIEAPIPILDPDLYVEVERMVKEAADKAKREQAAPKGPILPGSKAKTVGLKGTGNPKGTGGLGGSGGGPGAGNKIGAGIGKGGLGGRKPTDQEIFAWRWNFSLGNNGNEHARMLASIGVNVAVQDPKGQVYFITDLNRRPVELKKGVLPDPKEVVGWRNTRPESIQALARELQLPFTPVFVQMMLPKEREKAMAEAEARLAAEQRRDIRTVRKTWFEFRLQNGVYEPVGKKFE